MGDPHPITLPPELAGAVRAAAEWRGMSLEQYVREVVAMAARLDAELVADLKEGEDDAAAGRSFTQKEVEAMFGVQRGRLDTFVQEGTDAIDRGEVVPHEDVMVELDAMIEAQRARCG